MVLTLLFAILGLAAPPLAVGIRTGGQQPGSRFEPRWSQVSRLGLHTCWQVEEFPPTGSTPASLFRLDLKDY